MTTEESRESLDRAVEAAREELLISTSTSAEPGVRILAGMFNAAIMRFEAAVSAKARAEERERAEEIERILSGLVQDWAHWGSVSTEGITEAMAVLDERARSSEEAGNG